MSFIEYKVDGARELRKQLRQAGADMNDLKDANKRVGDVIAAAAQARAPKRSGALAGSVRAARAAGGVKVRAGSARLRYAPPIHWGWPARNIRGNAFISDAATASEHVWVQMYFAELQAVIDKVGGAS